MNYSNELLTVEEENTQIDRYLTFSIDNDSYGIGIEQVLEIITVPPITSVPDFPDYMKGVINLRGKIIPVIDIRLRLKKPEVPTTQRTCIIIVDVGKLSIGLIVDSIADVITIYEKDISLPLNIHKSSYLKGIGKSGTSVKLLLECKKLISEELEDELVINF